MKNKFTWIFFLLLIAGCAANQNSSKSEDYFEGKIVFKKVVHSNMENISDEELQKIFGEKVVKYYKNGNSYLITTNENNDIVEERLLLNEKGIKFITTSNRDSTIWYTCKKDKNIIDNSKISKGKPNELLGYKCETIIVENSSESLDSNVKYIYYFSKKFPLYPNINPACQDTIDRMTNSMILGWEIIGYPTADIKYIPISISEEKLNDSIFKLSSVKPLKELK